LAQVADGTYSGQGWQGFAGDQGAAEGAQFVEAASANRAANRFTGSIEQL
jgi:hypothetical protein